MRINLNLLDGSTVEIENAAVPSALVEFERQFEMSVSDAFNRETDDEGNLLPGQKPISLEHIVYLAYLNAVSRKDRRAKTREERDELFLDYLDTVKDFELPDAQAPVSEVSEDAADPTTAATL